MNTNIEERIRTLEEFCRKHLTTLSSLSQIVATTRQELEIVQHRNDQLQRQLNAVECLSKNLDEVKQRLDALEKHGMRVDMRLSEAHSQLDERVTRSLQQQASQIEMLTNKVNAIQLNSQQGSLPASQRTASSLLPGHNRIDNAGIGHFTTQGKRQNSPTSETSIEHERSQRFKQSHGQATGCNRTPLSQGSHCRDGSVQEASRDFYNVNPIAQSVLASEHRGTAPPAELKPHSMQGLDGRTNKENVIERLKRTQLPYLVKDSCLYFMFARLGKATALSPIIVSEDEFVRTSLISEKLANELIQKGHVQRDDTSSSCQDQWVKIDLSWPLDAGRRIFSAGQICPSFSAPQVRFLVVPKADMSDGLVLGKDDINTLELRIDHFDGPQKLRVCLALDGNKEVHGGIWLLFLKKKVSHVHQLEPFRHLCHVASEVATYVDSPQRIEMFRLLCEREEQQNREEERRA